MSSLDKMLGWFPHTATEWFELIINGPAAVAADDGGHIGVRVEFDQLNNLSD